MLLAANLQLCSTVVISRDKVLVKFSSYAFIFIFFRLSMIYTVFPSGIT